jgi:protein-disulfide isomerase
MTNNREDISAALSIGKGVARIIFAALAFLVVMGFAPQSYSAGPPPAAPPAPALIPVPEAPPPNALPPNPAIDAKVKDYVQKRFMIGDIKYIELGPVVPTPMAGIFARTLKVSNSKGQAVKVVMYTNANEDQIILSQAVGQMYDLTKDPWEKIDLKPLHLEDRPVLGPADAPVTIIEFADFECPFCARAFSSLETMVHTTYKDKVRVIYKNYPLNSHPWAIRAALGAECARLQNPETFWEFARDYYSTQGSITAANIDDHINMTAKRLGLDVPTLDTCMKDKAAQDRIDQDQKDGGLVGVSSTPTLFVNGIRLVGLPEDKAFNMVMTQQLEAAGKGKEMLRR